MRSHRPSATVLDRDGAATLTVDLRPDLPEATIAKKLAAVRKGESTSNRLRKAAGLDPAAIGLMREAAPTLPVAPEELAALVKSVPLRIEGIAPLARAISTAGGIAQASLDANLMLRARPGVFAAGEMLDWEAPTGGYLLRGELRHRPRRGARRAGLPPPRGARAVGRRVPAGARGAIGLSILRGTSS